MLLKKLVIKNGDTSIRKIDFQEGLNIITSVGNSVGKTTLLRSVDYCFGSDGTDLYTDSEHHTLKDNRVYNFLSDNRIIFELTFEISTKEYIIIRKFGTTDFKINDTEYVSLELFNQDLNKVIFGTINSKPSFRNMTKKFIRKDIEKMKYMTKMLHQSASKDDYMLFFFTLFHFQEPDLIFKKYFLNKEKTKLGARLKAVKGDITKNSLKQKIQLLDDDIKKYEDKVRGVDLIDASKGLQGELGDVQVKIHSIEGQLGKLTFKYKLNNDSLKLLSQQKSSIKTDYIGKLYENAKVSVGNLQKTLKDTVDFHNQMVDNKVTFIEKQIILIATKGKELKKELNILQKKEGEILRKVSDKSNFASVYKLQNELNKLSQEKGVSQGLLDLINQLEAEKKEVSSMLDEIDIKIDKYTKDFDNNTYIFNTYLKKYSKDVYGEEYFVSFSDDYKELIPGNFNLNAGGGEKKAYIGLFDMAYASYVAHKGSTYPRFILHDSVEDTQPVSLSKIFSLANTIEGQYIVSLLEDKIISVGKEELEKNIILSLSETDKFFKIEEQKMVLPEIEDL